MENQKMEIIANLLHIVCPIVAMIMLYIGIKREAIYYVISSLWLSLITLYIQFESAGWQILGSHFDYYNTLTYGFNLIILMIALIRVVTHITSESALLKYASSLFNAFIVISCLIVLTNLAINAYFIEHRMNGTPIMQVALTKKTGYCDAHYIFYKLADDGSVHYLCPDHYGFLPSIGALSSTPGLVSQLLPIANHA